jgi:hypothetical protein
MTVTNPAGAQKAASSAKSVRHIQKTRQIAHFLMVGLMAGKFI